ncbi:MICAL-like protein 1 isoform X1 [Astyanax mexicanus]|uniref:MICAL-like protein 1 isoform X1 n=1 Tax=Astyanax mexicanus TaxID=7994 RepID=UPI0020CB50C1|nr:MICAL-like protein 1 isoform X1 [Astyanax mexicanus]
MGSLKALQEWCRLQCEDYNDVEIKNMSSSFRDGLAFCAIIHRHRPDLIDFNSLSKENVYENNRLAFEVAERELGIPALLDPEDMENMKVPDRLSIITYVSQYYNFFTNKSHANPPLIKRPSGTGHIEPALKRPPTPLENRTPQAESNADGQLKRSTLSSTCAACGKHVHLVQRFLVDGKLYHRNCFRCRECSSTLLPGSYKLSEDAGSLVCTHHFTRTSSVSQNGRPDLSRQVGPVVSNPNHETPTRGRSLEKALPVHSEVRELAPSENQQEQNDEKEAEIREETEGGTIKETEPQPSSPPNPFDESDEEEDENRKEEEQPKGNTEVTNGVLSSTPVSSAGEDSRPVPAPRRVFDHSPPARPVPKPRPARPSQSPARPSQSPAVNGEESLRRLSTPVPRERSSSPVGSSRSIDTPKPKVPPWLALVKSEPKKKLAPPPPPATGAATPPHAGAASSAQEEESQTAIPSNPFDDDDEEEEEDKEGTEAETSDLLAPPSVVAVHPWYGITQAADDAGAATPSRKGSPAPSGSPGSGRSKKRQAPKVPKPSPTALPSSQSSSTCPSPALSTESLSSSSSDHGLCRTTGASVSPRRASANEQEHPFTKSVSEPSINSPGSSDSSPSAEPQSRLSTSPSPLPPYTNTCSAPATPESKRMRPPPPRPPAAPSPLIGSSSSQQPSTPSKRICKENPFNRKASPTVTSPQSRPPKGPRPARPPAPGHGFPLIKRKVQSDQYIPVEDIHVEMGGLEIQLDELEHRGVELEQRLRDCSNEEHEERLLVDWFTLIHEKHLLVRREAELVYTAKQQNLEERQADVEYELRCLLNKPEKEWSDDDRDREKQLMAELVTIIEQRNQIINSMDQDRQREEEEDKLVAAMLKKKEFHGESEQKKKPQKFKPMKVLRRLSTKSDVAKSVSPRKESTRKEKS